MLQFLNQELEKTPRKPPDLTKNQQQQLDQLLNEYQDIIANDKDPPGRINMITHPIITDNTPPIKQRPYRLSPAEHDFVG